jgi:hypothetical protein
MGGKPGSDALVLIIPIALVLSMLAITIDNFGGIGNEVAPLVVALKVFSECIVVW